MYQPDAVLAVGIARARDFGVACSDAGSHSRPTPGRTGSGCSRTCTSAGIGGGPYLEFPYDPPGWTPERRDFMLAEPLVPDADGA